MTLKRLLGVFLTLSLTTISGSSWAWGPVGHKAVAMIAESRLSPQALAAVHALLGPNGNLQEIANCPDSFIYDHITTCAGFPLKGDAKATQGWHYIDIPVYPDGRTVDVDASSIMKYCANDNCVVAQIHKDVETLKDPQASLNDKQMALMFLVHFVGDVHQPLHSATEFDAQVKDDWGGNGKNMVNITFNGKPVNLHSIWDDEIDSPADTYFGLPDATLTAKATSIADEPGKSVDAQSAASWNSGDIAVEAAIESHGISQDTIYPEYHQTNGTDTLEQYQAKMRSIAYHRIQMGGVRLAAVIEQALGSASAAPAPKAPVKMPSAGFLDHFMSWPSQF